MKAYRFLVLGAAVSLVLLLVACGGGSSSSGGGSTIPTVVSVSITPPTSGTAFNLNAQATFAAVVTVTNGASTAVTWSVQEGATGGSITSAGAYTAPSSITGSTASFHIVATAQADTTKSASQAITVSLGANPTFTSTPPASAVGGLPYSYTVAATVTPSSPITYSVTHGPIGATLTGAALSWTPSATQTNVATSFTVTATTLAGGSATQVWTITPTVPPLAFTSTPGATASVGTAYTYTAVATDVPGSVITYAFTAPAAATHSGGTLSWTPAPADGRAVDSFSVTATSNFGGTAIQPWTVSCAGPVTVIAMDKYWSMDGTYTPIASVSVSPGYDLSDVKAFVPNATGAAVTALSGTDNGDGTATIANVPPGSYWLQVTRGEWFLTNANTFNYGVDYIGRYSAATVAGDTLNWQLTGLDPWETEDALSFYVPNANVSDFTPTCQGAVPTGSTTFVCDLDAYNNYSVDFTKGDVSYILQTSTDQVNNATAVIAMGTSNTLAILDNAGDVPLASNLASQTGNLWEVNLGGDSAWASYAPLVNLTFPSTYTGFHGHANFYIQQQTQVPNVLAQTQSIGPAPFLQSAGMLPILDMPVDATPTLTHNFGQFHDYTNNVIGPFSTLFEYQVNGLFTPPASSLSVQVGIGHIGTRIPTNAVQDVPVMSPVNLPTIASPAASGSLFTTAVASETITLSWAAPTGTLAPVGYEVTVNPVLAADPTFYLYTATAPLTIPAGLLANGHQYVFTIRAVSDGSANFTTGPFHSSFPVAWADTVSGPITYSTAATPISLAIPAGPTARAIPAVPSRPGLRSYTPPISPLAQPVGRTVR